jgi:hypothetical protein
MSNKDQPNKAVRIDQWGFEGSWGGTGNRSGVPLIGIFLVALGLILVAGQLFPQAQVGASAFFLVVGALLILTGLRDRSNLALYVGVFIAALALADLLSGIGLIHGNGWGTLFLGIGIVGLALIRSRTGQRWGAAVVIGALIGIWGGIGVATSYLSLDLDRLVAPVLIVLLGVYIIRKRGGSRTS